MDDSTALIAGHSKRYNLPLSHFEHKYIQNCTDGKELERIYKELKDGEMGSFPDLEKLTLERLAKIKPKSQILRQDKPPSDRSAMPIDELDDFNDFLQKMKSNSQNHTVEQANNNDNNNTSVPIRNKTTKTATIKATSTPSVPITAPVIDENNKTKRVVPRSYAEWGKLEKSMGDESDSDHEERKEDNNNKKKNNNVSTPSISKPVNDVKERTQKADEHRLSGNTAFKSNNYQQSIDSYTRSIQYDDNNTVVYMNRAIAHFKLKNYDASLADCSQVLTRDPNHIKALFRRASCRLAKQQYNEAKIDLERLLELESTNLEAKNLLKSIPVVQKPKGVRIQITEDDDDEEPVKTLPSQSSIPSGPVKIPIMEVDEEEEEDEVVTETVTHQVPPVTMNIDIPAKTAAHNRPGIDSQDASPAMFDSYLHQSTMHYPISPNDTGMNQDHHEIHQSDGDDDDDDLPLGGEANTDMIDNMSDDEGQTSRNFNVSPTGAGEEDDDDDEPPPLINENHLVHESSLSIRTQNIQDDSINRSIAFQINNTYNRDDFTSVSYNKSDPHDHEMADESTRPLIDRTKLDSSYKAQVNRASSIVTAEYSSTSSHNDLIANSNFCPTIQNWLHEKLEYQSTRRSLSVNEKPWSRDRRPDTLNKLQLDIERFNRLSDFGNAIEASKKMLTNGYLDYHLHAEYIVNALVLCAQCNSKLKKYILAIQYATEALQYNKTDTNALLCRARAFENEDCLIFSYSDYARIPSNDPCYSLAKKSCETLAATLNKTKGDVWREELPDYTDDELYLKFIRMKDESPGDNFAWYRVRGNQLYMDGCYILAIRCYTICAELKPATVLPFLNRAACYYKVFEPRKAIEDCDRVLELEPTNVRALYRKACAHKLAKENQAYILTLQNLLKLQPNNQILLSEYYNFVRESMPRQKRRLRMNPTTTTTTSQSTSNIILPPPVPMEIKPIETNNISYEALETIRKKTRKMSSNTGYQFTNKLNSMKETDVEGQCQLFLSVPNKMLYSFAHNASPKIVEMILRVCNTMIAAERAFTEGNPSTPLPYSYTDFCFQLLVQLTTLPRLDSALGMIGEDYRVTLNEILEFYSSISSLSNDMDKLKRLQPT